MTVSTANDAPRALPWLRRGLVLVACLMVLFAIRRVLLDFPGLGLPAPPRSSEDSAYTAHRTFAYLHIVPGLVYLLGGALQLTARFRTRHYSVHRRLGRVVLVCGLWSGLLALAFGTLHAFGGPAETASVWLFGLWFELCLITAYRRIRAGDVVEHRRWMVRGYAVATAVGTMRLLLGPLVLAFDFRTAFWIAFWLGFIINVSLGEWWLRRTPQLAG